MFEKMNEKDKKTLKMGGIAAIAMLILLLTMQVYGNWNSNKGDYDNLMKDLNKINLSEGARSKIMSTIPVFQMPKDQQAQKEAFITELDNELAQLRITTDPWQDVTPKRSPVTDYGFLQLKCSGTCRFSQILDLLAALRTNPYLAGIEELNIQCDPQNPQQAKFSISVSTYTKKQRGKS